MGNRRRCFQRSGVSLYFNMITRSEVNRSHLGDLRYSVAKILCSKLLTFSKECVRRFMTDVIKCTSMAHFNPGSRVRGVPFQTHLNIVRQQFAAIPTVFSHALSVAIPTFVFQIACPCSADKSRHPYPRETPPSP